MTVVPKITSVALFYSSYLKIEYFKAQIEYIGPCICGNVEIINFFEGNPIYNEIIYKIDVNTLKKHIPLNLAYNDVEWIELDEPISI